MAAKLGGFPNILENIVLPAGRAIPLLSVLLFIALAALAVRVVFRQSVQVTSISALLVLVLTMVLAIAAIDTYANDRCSCVCMR
jgi:predicted membrane channel-forming protein YqfA (hemolysin III family)